MYILPGASKIEFRWYRSIDIIHLTLNNCIIKSPIANLNDLDLGTRAKGARIFEVPDFRPEFLT